MDGNHGICYHGANYASTWGGYSTFGQILAYQVVEKGFFHPVRSEGAYLNVNYKFFATLRMTESKIPLFFNSLLKGRPAPSPGLQGWGDFQAQVLHTAVLQES